MGVMAGGAETTEDDRFVWSESVQDLISRYLVKLEHTKNPRYVLGDFAWAVVRIREEGE